MFKITAKSVRNRVSVSRSGARIRRLPHVCLPSGAVIKISPGRSIELGLKDLLSNLTTLSEFEGTIDISRGNKRLTLKQVEGLSSSELEEATHAPQPVVETVVEVIEEPVVEHTVEVVETEAVEPAVEVAEVAVEVKPPPKRRKRRPKSEVSEDNPAKASPRKIRSRATKQVD